MIANCTVDNSMPLALNSSALKFLSIATLVQGYREMMLWFVNVDGVSKWANQVVVDENEI